MTGAPIYSGKYSSEDEYRKNYEHKMEDWRGQTYEEARRTLAMSPEISRVSEYMQYLEGQFWSSRRPSYLSSFSDNRMSHARYSTLSLLTDIRPTIDVHSNVPVYEEQANIAQNVIHHEWYTQDLDLSLVNVVDAALLFGNGFWKIGASMPGNMYFQPCGPDVVMPVQPGLDLQDSTAILYKSYKPLSYFQKRWPSRCYNLEREAVLYDQHQGTSVQRPPFMTEITWNSLSPQMKYRMGTKLGKVDSTNPVNVYPIVELQEYWVDDQSINESKEDVIVKDPYLSLDEHNYHYVVKPMQRLYPRKRLIVFAGKRLMYDGPSPYWHGLFPFAMMRLNPTMWSFWGLSKYRDLVPLNRALNEIGAGVMDSVKRALNPQMLAKENAIAKDAFERFFPNMPGGKLKMHPSSNPMTDVRYMDPPMLPSYVFDFTQFVTAEFDRLGGFVDTQSLLSKNQVPGGESIEAMRDAANPAVRLEGRYIEAFLRDAGTIAISNIFQFYTMMRRLKILGGRPVH